MKKILIGCVVLLFFMLKEGTVPRLTVFAQTPPPDITLYPQSRYQTITGWEATAQSGQNNPNFASYRDALFDLAVDTGITRVRLEVYSGAENSVDYYQRYADAGFPEDDPNVTGDPYDEWRCHRYATVDDNGGSPNPDSINWSGFHFTGIDDLVTKVIQPLQARALLKGKTLQINLEYVAFTAQINEQRCIDAGYTGLSYHHQNPQEYAEFITATSLYLKNTYGITPDTWELVLEPDNVSQWNGTTMGNALVATKQKLAANGFTPKFIVPSVTNMANVYNYFDNSSTSRNTIAPIIEDSGSPVGSIIEEIAYHRYGGVNDGNLQFIANLGLKYGVKTSMLEHIGSGYQDLHKDLKIANASAWERYALAGPDTAGVNARYFTVDASNNIIITDQTKYLQEYFKYIHPGAVRIKADAPGCPDPAWQYDPMMKQANASYTYTCGSTFDPLAFINPDGNYVIVVKATAAGSFTIGNLPPGIYGINYTNSVANYGVDGTDQTVTDTSLTASIPNNPGVITIYSKSLIPTHTPAPSTPTPTTTPVPTAPGDTDDDGDVDIFDYNNVITDFGRTGSLGFSTADFDDDGDVDIFDYNVVISNFGQ